MPLSGEEKSKIIEDYRQGESDTGSPEVQARATTETSSNMPSRRRRQSTWSARIGESSTLLPRTGCVRSKHLNRAERIREPFVC